MNGLRGAGKTMTAQLLANFLIKRNSLPVLVIKDPIPLQDILDCVKQDIVLIFDEFEKTHDKEDQQKLLSVIDGMGRSIYNRLIIFTTNSPTIDDNFKDRPSRIHYKFDFQRVSDTIIDGLILDILPAHLLHFKKDIVSFLHSRKICTMDIVKAVISEVKTFEESPLTFEDKLNISKGEPPSFTVSILDPVTNSVTSVISHYFKVGVDGLRILLGNKSTSDEILLNHRGQYIVHSFSSYDPLKEITLLERCKEENQWIAQIGVLKEKTLYRKFELLDDYGDPLYFDEKPKDWEFPFTPENVKNNTERQEKLEALFAKAQRERTVYGTGNRASFKILIEPNKDTVHSFNMRDVISRISSDDLS